MPLFPVVLSDQAWKKSEDSQSVDDGGNDMQVGGEGRCPIVDTWWQTETGGILITPLPGAWALKPGSATLPFFGVHPVLLDDKGRELDGPGLPPVLRLVALPI